MSNWKYTDASNTVVLRIHDDGRMESKLVSTPEIQAWLAEGNTPEPADPLPNPRIQEIYLLLDELDRKSIRALRTSDLVRLQDLESQAEILRQELRNIS